MTKNILFDCERMKYPYTGLYYFCLHLGKALLRNGNINNEKLSFYMPENGGRIFGDQNYIRQNSLHKFKFPSVNLFDVWHCTYQSSNYSPKSKKIKKILTIHDLNFLYETNISSGKKKYALRKIQTQIGNSDKICAISNYVKQDAEKYLVMNNKKIDVIYNGCNINIINNLNNPKILPDSDFIFTIGTIAPKKNFHVLPSLLKGNDMLLFIAGIEQDKNYKTIIENEAIKHGVKNRLIFTGAVSENDKQWYLKNCVAFAFPSIAEGFGLPVIEAMAFGKPVFLSTVTSLPEIGGDSAYYFENFDPEYMQKCFEKGLNNYYIHPEKSQQIKEHSLQFNWNKAASQYLNLYNN